MSSQLARLRSMGQSLGNEVDDQNRMILVIALYATFLFCN